MMYVEVTKTLGFSLATGRSTFEHRAVLLGGEREGFLDVLGALSRGEPALNVIEGVAPVAGAGGLAFLFTGQGAQRVGMGREPYEAFGVFRGTLDQLCTEFDAHLERPLLEVLFAPEDSPEAGLLDQTAFTQAGLFALEVALFKLIEGWGVRPDYLIGHSIGELAAAHVAGVFSLEDACALVAARGRLMGGAARGWGDGLAPGLRAGDRSRPQSRRSFRRLRALRGRSPWRRSMGPPRW
jgi:acyl transferase domain-containing protein